MKMNLYGDYHTHTRYSDGTGRVRDNVEAARAIGLHDIGISDHGYNNPHRFAMSVAKRIKQQAEIAELRKEFSDIKILSSVETDIISLDGTLDIEMEEIEKYDYIIAGFHRWSKAKSRSDYKKFYWSAYMTTFRNSRDYEVVRNTEAYIKMLNAYPIGILAHINNATMVDCMAVAEACSETKTLLELNVKHIVKNLGNGNFEKVLSTGVKFIASSDAHIPNRIGKLEVVEDFIEPYHLNANRLVNIGDKTPDFRTYLNWK